MEVIWAPIQDTPCHHHTHPYTSPHITTSTWRVWTLLLHSTFEEESQPWIALQWVTAQSTTSCEAWAIGHSNSLLEAKICPIMSKPTWHEAIISVVEFEATCIKLLELLDMDIKDMMFCICTLTSYSTCMYLLAIISDPVHKPWFGIYMNLW
jgi:hypothetical protein